MEQESDSLQHEATYSPEDNKLRLYPACRLSKTEYERIKAVGFKWAPKQEIFVAPAWTPAREDALLEMCEEIGDEDYSPEERSADRAERFEGYREKRTNEAEGYANQIGESTFGHQSRERAERQARTYERNRKHAITQWSKAEYWQARTAAVIRHALHKSSAPVRRSRLLRLEAEQRKHESEREAYQIRFDAWEKVPFMEGADYPIILEGYGVSKNSTEAARAAFTLTNSGICWGKYTHPHTRRTAMSLYSLMSDPQYPITAREAASLWLDGATNPRDPESNAVRWSNHYALRIEYEKTMLAQEGGMAAEQDMEPGGWIGKHQIHAVNRSPITGRVVSVKLMAPKQWWNGPGPAPMTLQSFNIERFPANAYRAPTGEEKEKFQTETKAKKKAAKASKPKAPPLINPSREDAETLQSIWNAQNAKKYPKVKSSEVCFMTQAEYTQRSKGSYSNFETVEVTEKIKKRRQDYNGRERAGHVTVFKVRTAGSRELYGADRVIHLTDVTQKPIPWEEAYQIREQQPTEESISLETASN